MASFFDAMSAPEKTKVGVKGCDVYTEEGVGDLRVALFTMLVRDLSLEDIQSSFKTIMATNPSEDYIRDLFVMAFQTRDIRGGKGEKDIFRYMIHSLFTYYPEYIPQMISIIPEYGCWKDLWALYGISEENETGKKVREGIDQIVCKQFRKDWVELDAKCEEAKLSLLAKWMPREGSKNDVLAKHFAKKLFPSFDRDDDRMRAYRKACSELNAALKTSEVNMCNHTWRMIVPDNVPGRCLKKYKEAFLNENPRKMFKKPKMITKPNGKKVYLKSKVMHRPMADVRCPDDEDRVQCAKNFKQFLEDAANGRRKAKGGNVVYPHEIIIDISYCSSDDQMKLLEAQWASIRETVAKEGKLSSIVPLCDFSGSMAGIPMEVSIALGILISEIAEPAFKDAVLSFDTNPQWVSFKGCKSLLEKVKLAHSAPWGGSTDFLKACNLILQRLLEHKVPPENAPKDMIVFTDMGFDAACHTDITYDINHNRHIVVKTKPWQTTIDMIRSAFEKHGYQAPRIVLWNLRAEYKDFHAQAHEDGVVMLSGWSPSILKAIQKNGVEVNTPYQGMRLLLDDKRYDAVRKAFDDAKRA